MATDLVQKTQTTTTTRHTLELGGYVIVSMLREFGHDIPDGASVKVYVPGGGDWSNMSLDIDSRCPVIVEWTTRTES